MIFTYTAALLLLLALVLQIAVDRAPDVKESSDNKSARRVLIAGLFVLALWMLRNGWIGIRGDPWVVFGLSMLALAEVAFCVNSLFPSFGPSVLHRHAKPGDAA